MLKPFKNIDIGRLSKCFRPLTSTARNQHVDMGFSNRTVPNKHATVVFLRIEREQWLFAIQAGAIGI